MTFKKITLAASAAALALAPAVAQAADADRSVAPVSGEQEFASSGVLAVLAAAFLGAFIFFAVDDDDDEPVSA